MARTFGTCELLDDSSDIARLREATCEVITLVRGIRGDLQSLNRNQVRMSNILILQHNQLNALEKHWPLRTDPPAGASPDD